MTRGMSWQCATNWSDGRVVVGSICHFPDVLTWAGRRSAVGIVGGSNSILAVWPRKDQAGAVLGRVSSRGMQYPWQVRGGFVVGSW